MKRIFSIMILATVAVGISQASDWRVVSHNGKVLVDINSVELYPKHSATPEYASVWEKILDTDGTYLLARMGLRASTHQYKILAGYRYNADGEITWRMTEPDSWTDILPDSVADTLYQLLFNSRQKPQPTDPFSKEPTISGV